MRRLRIVQAAHCVQERVAPKAVQKIVIHSDRMHFRFTRQLDKQTFRLRDLEKARAEGLGRQGQGGHGKDRSGDQSPHQRS